MGSFVFKWEHPASEVYVTGTFDEWSKSEKLEKTGDIFEKRVTLPNVDEKIYYKFVVDDNWVTDHTAPQENDASGNLNNFLTPGRITKHTPETAGIMAGVAPTSTTAELAKDVPLENAAPTEKAALTDSDLPGAFPETPDVGEKGDFSVNPLPAAAGAVNPIKLAPGEKVPDPSTFTQETVASGVHDDPELVAIEKENLKKAESEPTFGVAPLPAFEGAVNPIKLAPGEPVPDPATLTQNTVTSAVREDPELVALENATKAAPIQSAGPDSTTAQLAAAVPLESSKVPDVVKESQAEAGFPPEASAVPEEVADKGAVEKELLSEVPPAEPTSEAVEKKADESETVSPAEKVAAAAGGAAAAGAAAVAAIIAGDAGASSTAKDTPEVVKESIAESGQSPEAASNEEAVLEKKATENELLSEVKPETSTGEPAPVIAPVLATGATAKDTPEVVKESIAKSGQSPEAASNEEAVLEKKATENELLSDVKRETSTGEPAPVIAPVVAAGTTAKDTPEVVKESIAKSGQSPEAASNEGAVLEKKATEKELLSEVKPETSTGEPAPKVTPVAAPVHTATTDGLNAPAAAAVPGKPAESREVSPRTVPGAHPQTQTAPVATDGIVGTTTDKTSAAAPEKKAEVPPAVAAAKAATSPKKTTTTPAAAAASPATSTNASESPTSSAAAEKKKKRTSIFGKLKAKFSDKAKN